MCYQQWCNERPAEGNITSLGWEVLGISIAIWASPGCEGVHFGVQRMCTFSHWLQQKSKFIHRSFLGDGGCLLCMPFLWTWSGCDCWGHHHYLYVTMKMKWPHSLCQGSPMTKYQPTEELHAEHFGKVEILHLLLGSLVHFGCFGWLTLLCDR